MRSLNVFISQAMKMKTRSLVFSSLVLMAGIVFVSNAAKSSSNTRDWPRFWGPHGTGISDETGLLCKWPGKGPQEIWRVPIDNGYSGLAISKEG